jgi:periplasmic copper chaperone A
VRSPSSAALTEEAFAVFRSSSGKPVARRLTFGALALMIPALAGCEAGLNAPTLEYHAASAGAHTVFNGISINNVFVLGAPSGSSVPAGSSASMFLALFNNGTNADKLVSISAPGSATSVKVTGGGVDVPASSSVNLTGPQPSVVLSHLTKPLASGGSISVVLDFQHAGAVTLQVPVEPHAFYYSTFSPPPATPSAKPSTAPAKPAVAKPPLGTASPTPTQ